MLGHANHGETTSRPERWKVRPEFAVCGQRLEIAMQIQGLASDAVRVCAYTWPRLGRRGVPTGVDLGLEKAGFLA